MRDADVLIQAGHEGRRVGATGASGPLGDEIEWTPIVADEATAVLRAAGVSVIREKAEFSGRYNVRIAVFIHFDGADDTCVSGASIGYDDSTDKPAAERMEGFVFALLAIQVDARQLHSESFALLRLRLREHL